MGAYRAFGGAVVADLYPPGQRGSPVAIYAAVTMAGPNAGLMLGGVVPRSFGWRWVFGSPLY
jgi:MFS family permease